MEALVHLVQMALVELQVLMVPQAQVEQMVQVAHLVLMAQVVLLLHQVQLLRLDKLLYIQVQVVQHKLYHQLNNLWHTLT
jgi:hypothetical protein